MAITKETRSTNERLVCSFHVHVNNRRPLGSPRSPAKVTLLSPWLTAARRRIYPRELVAVVVRAAVIAIPRIVRIIVRRVVSIIFRLGRANPIIGVVSIRAAAKQKCKSHGADQREDR